MGLMLASPPSSSCSLRRAFSSPFLRSCTAYLLTESIMPMAALITIIDVPPLLMKGSGCPETGMRPVTMNMCMSACVTIRAAQPMMSRAGNALRHLAAMMPARATRQR